MKKTLTSIILLTAAIFCLNAESGKKFEFKQNKDDAYRYLSTVEEDVYYNGYLNHHAQIINRISSRVVNAAADGEAFIFADYMTTDDSISNKTGRHLVWGEESTSVFARKKSGELTISDDIFMPTVRNVPVFPQKPVKKGEKWTAEGKEVQVRKAFKMEKPLIFPFTANYLYKEDLVQDKTTLNVITVDYTFDYESSDYDLANGTTLASSTGYSKQVLYWDSAKGLLDHYTEQFEIRITDIYGNIYIFTGTASAEKTDKGLTISLDKIQFEPDSDILLDSEKLKLEKIAEILKQFSNDLLITGHCADRGTVKARQLLSEQRAQSVASYLEELGVRDEYHIFTQGKGSTEPVASNATEEGRIKNRRVEITIME